MVTFAFPSFFRVTVCTLLFPIVTLPNAKDDVLQLSSGADATAFPLKETVSGVAEALVTTETPPDKVPTALGAYVTSNVAFIPAAIVTGKVAPVIATPAAVALALEMVMVDSVSFDTVTDCDAVPPTATDPKVMEAGARETVPVPVPGAVEAAALVELVTPVQPKKGRVSKIRMAREATLTAFRGAEPVCFARLAARVNGPFMFVFFIAAIVICVAAGQLLTRRSFEGQGGTCTLAQVRREAAGCALVSCAARRIGLP